MFKVTLEVNNEELKGQGKTILEALNDLNPWNKGKIFFFKTKGTLVLTDSHMGRRPKIIRQHIWPMQLKRSFNKFGITSAMKLLIRRLEEGLKAGLTEKNPTELIPNDEV